MQIIKPDAEDRQHLMLQDVQACRRLYLARVLRHFCQKHNVLLSGDMLPTIRLAIAMGRSRPANEWEATDFLLDLGRRLRQLPDSPFLDDTAFAMPPPVEMHTAQSAFEWALVRPSSPT